MTLGHVFQGLLERFYSSGVTNLAQCLRGIYCNHPILVPQRFDKWLHGRSPDLTKSTNDSASILYHQLMVPERGDQRPYSRSPNGDALIPSLLDDPISRSIFPKIRLPTYFLQILDG